MIVGLRRGRALGPRAILWALTVLVFAFVALSTVSGPANAALQQVSLEEVRAIDCQRQTYFGFETGATAEFCDALFFLPTSAAFKCSLYKDAGYPSSLMEKACLLYDRGFIQSFTEGADDLN